MIETADGKLIKLEKLSAPERAAKAKLLLASKGNKVYRHLIDGDVLLVNRQPSLHKASIMAHKARVLKHVKEQTLRMHYANCNSYNADFDGDEMNCHFVQNEIARSEANFVMNTDNQYIVPTSGNPLRGLIQDHIAGAVKLTCKDTFLTKQEFQQLLFIAASGLAGTEIAGQADRMETPRPAILKPRPMWTGKQVISAVLTHLCRPPLPPLNLDGKTRTPPTALGAEELEHVVTIRQGQLLTGVMDKAAIGNSSLGLVHAVYELYGAEHAGRLLGSIGRLMTFYLQDVGHTCGIEDLTLTAAADNQRNILLNQVQVDAHSGLRTFLDNDAGTADAAAANATRPTITKQFIEENETRIAALMHADRKNGKVRLDGAMQGLINKSASDVIKACLPNGLELPFLRNSFTIMVSTGAKGSAVNQSQITCFLGQQALEGQRVPVMVSGKTLPSFRSFDSSPRAGGFVRDRFLTGVKPQEYYFHCMAGREGLVDTAVKTSRSGYLQRCLIKHLEELKVNYDMTVRDSGGNVVQFLYGEDGLDPVNTAVLGGKGNQMLFLARNNRALAHKYSLQENQLPRGLDVTAALTHHRNFEHASALLQKVQAMRKSSPASASENSTANFAVGSVVLARKRYRSELGWSVKNMSRTWHTAQIIKVHSKSSGVTFDVRYSDDQSVEKKIPVVLMVPNSSESLRASDESGGSLHGCSASHVPVPLLMAGLPDPAMSVLPIGSSVGCVSEKIQEAIRVYSDSNPDGAVTKESSSNTVSREALELLVWIKYMRSLACPGEAVGCIAAQSIGEPSTQMTLNTFHLAGHGGANVTLGIPRLREIIMTASKTLKTPTMTIPLAAERAKDMAAARALARSLSRLPLATLLDHRGGVEVGERLQRGDSGFLERCYRVRLLFANPTKIEEAFGVTFSEIFKSVKSMFLSKLSYIIKLEQRRAGEKTSGKQDALNQFRSASGGEYANLGKRRKGEDDEGEEREDAGALGDIDDDEGGRKGKGRGTKEADVIDALLDGDDEDEDADEDDDINDDLDAAAGGKSSGAKSKRQGEDYDDDDEEEGEEAETDSQGDDVKTLKDSRKTITGKSATSVSVAGSQDRKVKFRGVDTTDSEDDDFVELLDAAGDDIEGPAISSSDSEDEGGNVASLLAKNIKPAVTKALRTVDKSSKSEGLIANESEGWIELQLSFPAQSRKLLMVQLAERAAQGTTVRSTKGIANAYAQQLDDQRAGVQTEGVNFQAIWTLPQSLVEYNSIKSNDIWAILQTYGVEAARQSIVSEMNGVFGVYGIDVNPRHLSLIADFMTRTGSYVAMNRIGMTECPSTLLQMSFETTCTFLFKAAQEGNCDPQESPSARIVLGNVTKIGTGCFDVMVPVDAS